MENEIEEISEETIEENGEIWENKIITTTAEDTLKYRSKERNDWFDNECQKAIEERRKARMMVMKNQK